MQWKTPMLVLPDRRHLRFGDAVQRNILSAWSSFLPTGRHQHSEDVSFTPEEVAAGAPERVKVPSPGEETWVPLRVEVSQSGSPSRPFLVYLKGDGVVESFLPPPPLRLGGDPSRRRGRHLLRRPAPQDPRLPRGGPDGAHPSARPLPPALSLDRRLRPLLVGPATRAVPPAWRQRS